MSDENLKSFRVDQFAMGGLGAPPAAAAAPPAAAEGRKDGAKDSGYPTIEAVLNDKKKFEAMATATEKTVKTLEEIAAKGGSAQEKADARKALRGYDHAMELLQKGLELSAKIAEERQAKAKAAKAKAPGKKK